MTAPDRIPLRHGYTMRDLDRIAHIAISRRGQYAACDTDERYAAAWHAAVETLYTAEEPPARHDLIRAAWDAADAHTTRTGEQRGHARARGETYTGRTDMPRWHAYWETVTRHAASPEEPVVERLALAQIWPQLTPGQQAALHALATHGDYQAAADALCCSRPAFYRQVRLARARVLALWWEGETPRRGWRDRRVQTPGGGRQSASVHIRRRARAGAA